MAFVVLNVRNRFEYGLYNIIMVLYVILNNFVVNLLYLQLVERMTLLSLYK